MNQIEVIKKCKENDYSAQVELYNAYKNMLYSSCFRILKNREDAEDMVHDAFIKGFKKIDQAADDINIGAWFRRIAINTALDKIRKEKYSVILVLYLIEDYNHREIATQLNLKESTVRNQYARGKSQLLQMIQNK